jgi:hypothetical protein
VLKPSAEVASASAAARAAGSGATTPSAVKLISPMNGMATGGGAGAASGGRGGGGSGGGADGFAFDMNCIDGDEGADGAFRAPAKKPTLPFNATVLHAAQKEAIVVSPVKHDKNAGNLGDIAAAVHPIESPPPNEAGEGKPEVRARA